jgi:hypothetical protein
MAKADNPGLKDGIPLGFRSGARLCESQQRGCERTVTNFHAASIGEVAAGRRPALRGKAGEGRRTPRRWREWLWPPITRSVLECGGRAGAATPLSSGG